MQQMLTAHNIFRTKVDGIRLEKKMNVMKLSRFLLYVSKRQEGVTCFNFQNQFVFHYFVINIQQFSNVVFFLCIFSSHELKVSFWDQSMSVMCRLSPSTTYFK